MGFKSLRKVEFLESKIGNNEITLDIRKLKKAFIWKPCDQDFWRISLFFKFNTCSIDQFTNEPEVFETQKLAIKFTKEILKMDFIIQREKSLKTLQKKWGLK
tara:strand:+ start:648 stop:953 length:306 start_codon:yes stop_codon:yes gene_type:complete